jgi:hypothetical protein
MLSCQRAREALTACSQALSCAAPRAASLASITMRSTPCGGTGFTPSPTYRRPKAPPSAARAFAELFTNGWEAPVSSRSRLVIPTLATSARARDRHQSSGSRLSAGGLVRRGSSAGCDAGSARKIHSGVAVTIQVAAGWQVVGSVRTTS